MTGDQEIAKRVAAGIRDPAGVERERERVEFYGQLDEMSEAEVDRYVHLGEWGGNATHMAWAQAWLRERHAKQEGRALAAAERTAISTKATALAVASLAWSVWGP